YTRQDMAHHCANCPKCPEAERNEARETLRRQDARKALKSASKASKKVTVQAQKAPPTPPQAQRPTRTASVPTEITPLRLGLPTQRDLSVHSENAGEIPGPPYEQSLSNNAIATHQKATSLSGYIPRHPSSTSRTPNHHTAIQPTPLQAQRPTRTAPSPTEYPPLPDLGLPTQRDLSVYRGENAGEIPGQRYEQSLHNNAIATHQKATSLSEYVLAPSSSSSRTPNHHTMSMEQHTRMLATTSYNNNGASMAGGVPSPWFDLSLPPYIVDDNGSGPISLSQYHGGYEHNIVSQPQQPQDTFFSQPMSVPWAESQFPTPLTGHGGYQPNTQLMQQNTMGCRTPMIQAQISGVVHSNGHGMHGALSPFGSGFPDGGGYEGNYIPQLQMQHCPDIYYSSFDLGDTIQAGSSSSAAAHQLNSMPPTYYLPHTAPCPPDSVYPHRLPTFPYFSQF
ncbi:hypothetical protein C0991_006478, partial [Blastosporella zonata]